MSKVDLAAVVGDVKKLYAKDTKIQRIIGTGDKVKRKYLPSDCVCVPEGHPLAVLSGLPGIPFNKMAQVAGPPDTGKSTFGGELMAQAQRDGTIVVLWDSEEKFDANRFQEEFGGKPKDVLLIQTNEIRYGGELVRKYVHAIKKQDADAKILIVWDSIGGSQSRSHAEFDMSSDKSSQPGQDAKENAMFMKVVVALINTYPDSIAVFMANQTYAKIGFMQKGDKASGGSKVEFHSSLIIFLKRIKTLTKQIKGVKVKEGIITRATVTKNHLTPGKTSVYQLDFKITAEGARLVDALPDEEVEEDEGECR